MSINLNDTFSDAITIFLKLNGSACNMHCSYCYSHVDKFRAQDHISCSVDGTVYYLTQFAEYRHVFLVFHGGEPLLTPIHNIEAILARTIPLFQHEVHIQFQTNGTLLSDEWIRLFQLYDNKLSLSISLDPVGEKDLRYAAGFDYRAVVIENLKKYTSAIRNIGVISVAHRYNKADFKAFIETLIALKVPCLTINKYQSDNPENDEAYLTEKEYIELLIDTAAFWLEKRYFFQLNLQPIQSLFSKNGSKICRFLADDRKCTYFRTFYSEQHHTSFCDHVINNQKPCVPEECIVCNIYKQCGGGCLLEKKDDTFCQARHMLVNFLKEMRL